VTRARILYGVLRCLCCKLTWSTNWVLHAPQIICHECGGAAVPEGPQVPVQQAPHFTTGWEWQIQKRQVERLRS
jgi:hypothetical protein